jgi:pimeloyl-ACP methyl ester carboxylesterase
VSTVFDSPTFNERLFLPRYDESSCPAGAEDCFLTIEGDVKLHARVHWADSARATFVVFHGNGEVVADYDILAGRYHSEVGSHLVVIDFRGYGKSTGTPTFRDCIADAPRALSELRAQFGARLVGPVVVLGRSLGGACAAELAGQPHPLVDAVVLESAPADLSGIIRRRGFGGNYVITEEERSVFDPRVKISRSDLPILVLHGEEDVTIRPHEARASFSVARHQSSRLVLIPRRGHGDVLHDNVYYEALAHFVQAVRLGVAQGPELSLAHAVEPPLGSLERVIEHLYRVQDSARDPSRGRVSRAFARAIELPLRLLKGLRRRLRGF